MGVVRTQSLEKKLQSWGCRLAGGGAGRLVPPAVVGNWRGDLGLNPALGSLPRGEYASLSPSAPVSYTHLTLPTSDLV